MSDFGLTPMIQKHLSKNRTILKKAHGIFTHVPPETPAPHIHLDPIYVGQGFESTVARVDYKMTVTSHYKGSKEIQDLVAEIIKIFDGKTLKTNEGKANFRLGKVSFSVSPDNVTRLGICVFSILMRLNKEGEDL